MIGYEVAYEIEMHAKEMAIIAYWLGFHFHFLCQNLQTVQK